MSEAFLNEQGLTRFTDNLLDEVDKRIASGGGGGNGSGIPVGFEYFQTNPNIRAGSLPLTGGTYSRTIYADLWAWIQGQDGYLITESEWQSKAEANSGAVPFYSDGDGSTTFRVPALTVWCKGANGDEAIGDYLADAFESHKHNVTVSEDGAHTHTRGTMNITGGIKDSHVRNNVGTTGCGYGAVTVGANRSAYTGSFNESTGSASWDFDASKSWTGETSSSGEHSHTVTLAEIGGEETRPKTIIGIYCVIAYSVVTSSGAIDLDDIKTAIDEAESKIKDYGEYLITKDEIFEAARRASDVEVDPEVATVERLQTAVSAMESNLGSLDNKLDKSTVHIVETWKNGTNWYRKYSDGFIEQGGVLSITNWVKATVTLPTPFSNTNYSISVSGISYNASSNGLGCLISKDASSFTHYFFNSQNVPPSWYACGY